MKRADLIDSLGDLRASELAELAGVSLNRGRPSSALRESLIENILVSISQKQITVKRDGTLVRK